MRSSSLALSSVRRRAADVSIPPAALFFMAQRAHAREIFAVTVVSHLVMVSHPDRVAALIEDAANAQ